MELAIDTSTEQAGVALSKHGEPFVELSWYSYQNHTVELIPGIEQALKTAKLTVAELNAIAVAKGPGSFNGLRVGISTAKGLALSLGIPLLAISTMEVEAFAFAYSGLPICVIHNAGRGEIAVAKYVQKTEWECIELEHLTTIDILINTIKSRTVFCGEIPDFVIVRLSEKIPGLSIVPNRYTRIRRPGFLAALGWQQLHKGNKVDPADLQPTYLRQPPITLMKNKILKK